jgi:hypothetical protein
MPKVKIIKNDILQKKIIIKYGLMWILKYIKIPKKYGIYVAFIVLDKKNNAEFVESDFGTIQ